MSKRHYPYKLKKSKKWTRFPIVKSSGNIEPFSPMKLTSSLRRSGLSPGSSRAITDEVLKNIIPGTTTKDIYRKAFKLVRLESNTAAAHYSLKRAILELGPTGYEFERFVAKYFQTLGYKTEVGVVVPGEFVNHEVDIIATKPNECLYVECKFHNHVGRANDIKIALYVKARWDDLRNGPTGKKITGFCVASNTIFTKDAIQYASGTGLQLLGVNAPAEYSFLQTISEFKLYPITTLRRLKKYMINQLLDKDIILCRELLNEKPLLRKFGLDEQEIDLLFNDIKELLKI